MKNENIMIKTNTHGQHINLTDSAAGRRYRTNYATCPINTLNLKMKVTFSQNLVGTHETQENLSLPSCMLLNNRMMS